MQDVTTMYDEEQQPRGRYESTFDQNRADAKRTEGRKWVLHSIFILLQIKAISVMQCKLPSATTLILHPLLKPLA